LQAEENAKTLAQYSFSKEDYASFVAQENNIHDHVTTYAFKPVPLNYDQEVWKIVFDKKTIPFIQVFWRKKV
jgi:hypothetical protein